MKRQRGKVGENGENTEKREKMNWKKIPMVKVE